MATFDISLRDNGSNVFDISLASVVSGAYTLTAQTGVYTLTGQSATITRSRLITALTGSYATAGQSATITRSRLIAALTGNYALSGVPATITRSRLITALNGVYSLDGKNAVITYTGGAVNYTITAQTGVYSISGQSATVSRNRVLTAQTGTYSLTGQSATITKSTSGAYTLTCLTGVYSLNGQNATITYSGETIQPSGGDYYAPLPRRKKKLEREVEEENQLSERDQEIKELLLIAQKASKKTAKSIKAERKLALPMIEAKAVEITQPQATKIIIEGIIEGDSLLSDDEIEMMLALMMEMM